jgi:uncharacterized protein (TIGR00255 family)
MARTRSGILPVPPIQSMTGFARCVLAHPAGTLCCEIRSVNHRYLELQLRTSDALRGIESGARERLRERLGRGKVDCLLKLHARTDGARALALDEALLEGILAACARIEAASPGLARPSSLDVLRWPGLLIEDEPDTEVLGEAALALLEQTLAELIGMRAREGGRLATLIAQRLDGIEALISSVRAELPQALAAQSQRLRERVAELLVELPPDRVEQELVLLAARADIAEELDRLGAHVSETRRSLQAGGPCGRRLDFLMQEFNREANTLSSKSAATATTQAAVEMKVLIEQMREQVQNIE